jgi:hypothetical protein
MGVKGLATDWGKGAEVQPNQSVPTSAAKSHAEAWLFNGSWIRVMWRRNAYSQSSKEMISKGGGPGG